MKKSIFSRNETIIFSNPFYYSTIYKIEMNHHTESDIIQKAYTLKQLDRLKVFLIITLIFTGTTVLEAQTLTDIIS